MNIILYIAITILSITLTAGITKFIIPKLKNKEFQQKILEEGPKWHKKKEGTPTMGGLSFILTITIILTISLLVLGNKVETKQTLLFVNIILFSVLNALIGAIDDLVKINKKKNKGLSGKSKFFLQSIVAVVFLMLLHHFVDINTTIIIPFFDYSIDIGILYYFISYLLLCGIVNSVNLSDGIDGLATSLIMTVALFFSVCAFTIVENQYLLICSASIFGSAIGFLIYNKNPAKIFMGDTGSLYLGALIVSLSFVLDNIVIVLIYGGIFVIEAISDILQVMYFKLTKGKRLFLMAPLHHHFEKRGWSENKIVCVFSLINVLFCILAFISML